MTSAWARVAVLVDGSPESMAAASWVLEQHRIQAPERVILVRATIGTSGFFSSAAKGLFRGFAHPTSFQVEDGDKDPVFKLLLPSFKTQKVEVTAFLIHCQYRRESILQLVRDQNITHVVLGTGESRFSLCFWSESFSETLKRRRTFQVSLVNEKGELVLTLPPPATRPTSPSETVTSSLERDCSGLNAVLHLNEDDDESSQHHGAKIFFEGGSNNGSKRPLVHIAPRGFTAGVSRVEATPSWEIAPGSRDPSLHTGVQFTAPISIPSAPLYAANNPLATSAPSDLNKHIYWIFDAMLVHAGARKPFAQELARFLYDLGYKAFVDIDALHPGDDGPSKISDTLATAPIGVGLIDRNVLASPHPLAELERVMEVGTVLLPVIIDMSFDEFKEAWRDSKMASASYFSTICQTAAIVVDSKMTPGEICKRIGFALTRIYVNRVCNRLPDSIRSSPYLARARKAVKRINAGINAHSYNFLKKIEIDEAAEWVNVLDGYVKPRSM